MRRIILSAFLILFSFNFLLAQNGRVQGIVSDKTTNDIIPFAAVMLISDSKPLQKGNISNGNGAFLLDNLKYGNYKLLVSFMGYKTDTISKIILSKQNPKINLGNIQLKPSSIDLEEVEVKANSKTVISKIDRQTYRAVDFATAKGGTAIDLLSKLPSVSVDPDGSVSVRGTSDFTPQTNDGLSERKVHSVGSIYLVMTDFSITNREYRSHIYSDCKIRCTGERGNH